MDLLTLLVRLPFLPMRSLVRLAEIIRDQAEEELYSPAAVRRQLEEIEEEQARGEISGQDAARAEAETVGRVVTTQSGDTGRNGTR
jgi:cytochrome c-type biogenesis protein CcmH/NrfG